MNTDTVQTTNLKNLGLTFQHAETMMYTTFKETKLLNCLLEKQEYLWIHAHIFSRKLYPRLLILDLIEVAITVSFWYHFVQCVRRKIKLCLLSNLSAVKRKQNNF